MKIDLMNNEGMKSDAVCLKWRDKARLLRSAVSEGQF